MFERGKQKVFQELFGNKYYTYKLDDWVFTEEAACDKLLKQFETTSLKGFGISNLKLGIIAAGAILQYLDITQHHKIKHISALARIDEEHYVWLDRFTMRNLELFQSINEGAKTLFDVINKTISPMGSRLMKRWIALPLKDIKPINDRLDIVEYFLKNPEIKEEI